MGSPANHTMGGETKMDAEEDLLEGVLKVIAAIVAIIRVIAPPLEKGVARDVAPRHGRRVIFSLHKLLEWQDKFLFRVKNIMVKKAPESAPSASSIRVMFGVFNFRPR